MAKLVDPAARQQAIQRFISKFPFVLGIPQLRGVVEEASKEQPQAQGGGRTKLSPEDTRMVGLALREIEQTNTPFPGSTRGDKWRRWAVGPQNSPARVVEELIQRIAEEQGIVVGDMPGAVTSLLKQWEKGGSR